MARPDLDQARMDYGRVTRALAFLEENWRARPSLEAAAGAAGVSPHHFHRMFARWTGTSPKRFAEAFAHAFSRSLLADGASVLEAALEAGLSGPSRLHDLVIAHESVTPGDAKRRGEGLEFRWGAAATPFGTGVFLIAPRGLSGLAFARDNSEDNSEDNGEDIKAAFADLAARFPAADFTEDNAAATAMAERVFGGGNISLALYGSPFQRQVWRALLAIPDGACVSYGDIAQAIGRPGAGRAVGAAVGRNPVSWLIPCHRALSADARLTGYHWGVERKRAMLAWETFRALETRDAA
jgi:AraC family transcriptional regulator of adaptative response/methylated-DNA-[protein]-cysteine methyltransferase